MTRRGLVLFVAMCLIWGIPYLFIRIAVSEISPATLVFLRTVIAALVLIPIAIRQGGFRDLFDEWRPLVFFVGVAAIVGLDLRATGWVPLVEIAVVVVCYATGPAILARYLSGLPAAGVNAAALALCAIGYAPLAASSWPRTIPSVGVLGSVAVLALVCSALGFLIFFALIAEIGPVRATVITYINPAVAALAGILVLHENFTAGMGIGFVLVLAGSTLATRRARQRQPGLVEEAITLRDR